MPVPCCLALSFASEGSAKLCEKWCSDPPVLWVPPQAFIWNMLNCVFPQAEREIPSQVVHLILTKHRFFQIGSVEEDKEHQGMWEAQPVCQPGLSEFYLGSAEVRGLSGSHHHSSHLSQSNLWQCAFSCSHSYAPLCAHFSTHWNIMRGKTAYPQLLCW